MKSPEVLSHKLARQWENANLREERLRSPDPWPIVLPIGAPTGSQIETNLDSVRGHIEAWRRVSIGTVKWADRRYRNASEPISSPDSWRLEKPSD